MNRVNPLYIGFLLILIIIFLLFKLSEAKTELVEAKKSYKESVELSTKLSSLKKTYRKDLKSLKFKSSSVVKKITKSGIQLSSKSMDIKELNSLMSKVLNGAYNITKLKIQKLNATNVSLELEIKW